MTREFSDDLAASKADAMEPIWERFYRGYFPNFERMQYSDVQPKTSLGTQRLGIDRVIWLYGDEQEVTVDEKVSKYTDDVIFLEFGEELSDGTVVDKGVADWANMNTYTVFKKGHGSGPEVRFFPWETRDLQRAWRANKDKWLADYGKRMAAPTAGKSSRTLGVPVPAPVIDEAIAQIRAADIDKEEERRLWREAYERKEAFEKVKRRGEPKES